MLVNLTPHPVRIVRDDAHEIVVPPSGQLARCAQRAEPAGTHAGVPLQVLRFGALEGLPAPAPGTRYIVSALALQAACAAGRHDCVAPADPVRDAQGQIVGCRALAVCCARGAGEETP